MPALKGWTAGARSSRGAPLEEVLEVVNEGILNSSLAYVAPDRVKANLSNLVSIDHVLFPSAVRECAAEKGSDGQILAEAFLVHLPDGALVGSYRYTTGRLPRWSRSPPSKTRDLRGLDHHEVPSISRHRTVGGPAADLPGDGEPAAGGYAVLAACGLRRGDDTSTFSLPTDGETVVAPRGRSFSPAGDSRGSGRANPRDNVQAALAPAHCDVVSVVDVRGQAVQDPRVRAEALGQRAIGEQRDRRRSHPSGRGALVCRRASSQARGPLVERRIDDRRRRQQWGRPSCRGRWSPTAVRRYARSSDSRIRRGGDEVVSQFSSCRRRPIAVAASGSLLSARRTEPSSPGHEVGSSDR